MNGGIVPLVLLGATIGLLLAFVALRTALFALAAFVVAALIGWGIPVGPPPGVVFIGLWLSMIIAAALVYVPVARWSITVLPLSFNAGFWLGASAALAGDRGALAIGLLPALVAIPARWLAQRNYHIVIRVAASWLIAIAALSLFVSMLPTPGYEPDHME